MPQIARGASGITLQVVRGSGEFQTLETAITVSKPEALTLLWTTDQAGAMGGVWEVTNVSAGNTLVAWGECGKGRFTIAANAFLQSAAPATQSGRPIS